MRNDVLILTSSARARSSTARLGVVVAGHLAQHGLTPSLVHAGSLGLPVCTGALDQARTSDVVARWRRQAYSHRAHVWVAAEWHGSVPGALKNALDHLEVDQMRDSVVGLVGQSGGLLPPVSMISHLRTIADHFGMWRVPTSIAVGVDQVGPPLAPAAALRMDRMTADLIRAVGGLHDVRRSA